MIPLRFVCCTLILLLGCSLPHQGRAQYQAINANPAGRVLLTAGLDQVYNNEFSAAEATFTQLDKLSPNHPAVDLLRGVSLFYQWFPARTKANLQQRCVRQLELAARKAEDWQQAQANQSTASERPEAMFIYFTAEAMLAKINHYEHANLATIRYAKNAYPYIQRGKTYQAQYPDFYLSTGLYNFYREVYPEIHPVYKTVAWVMTAGNKTLGLQQLQLATQKALLVRTEALLYLTHLLVDYENRPHDALPYLTQLVIHYPDNPYWRYQYGEALLNAHQTDLVPPIIKHLAESKDPVFHQFGTLLNARYALATGQRPLARSLAETVLQSSLRDESARAYAYLVLARVARLGGQEKQARHYYKQMLELAEYPVLRNEVP